MSGQYRYFGPRRKDYSNLPRELRISYKNLNHLEIFRISSFLLSSAGEEQMFAPWAFSNQIPGRRRKRKSIERCAKGRVPPRVKCTQGHNERVFLCVYILDGGRLGDKFERSGRCAWWIAADGNLWARGEEITHTKLNSRAASTAAPVFCWNLASEVEREREVEGSVGMRGMPRLAWLAPPPRWFSADSLVCLFFREAPQVEISHMGNACTTFWKPEPTHSVSGDADAPLLGDFSLIL